MVKTSTQPFHERPARWSAYDPRHTLYSTDEKLEVMAYTDGSTEPGSDSPSGFGIALHEVGRPAGAKELAGPYTTTSLNVSGCLGLYNLPRPRQTLLFIRTRRRPFGWLRARQPYLMVNASGWAPGQLCMVSHA